MDDGQVPPSPFDSILRMDLRQVRHFRRFDGHVSSVSQIGSQSSLKAIRLLTRRSFLGSMDPVLNTSNWSRSSNLSNLTQARPLPSPPSSPSLMSSRFDDTPILSLAKW